MYRRYMDSGRERLINAAVSLLAEHPDREPSTRDLYEAAGVSAPTLYHHFGTKDGLLDAVAEQTFDEYLERKNAVPSTGDLLADFAAGWDLHVEFGVQHPFLYHFLYGRVEGRQSVSAVRMEAELRRRLQLLADEGLLRVSVDEAVGTTIGMAVGCVIQLIHDGGPPDGPTARAMRDALISILTQASPPSDEPARAAELVLTRLGTAAGLFTPAEEALLRQWLRTLADHFKMKGSTA